MAQKTMVLIEDDKTLLRILASELEDYYAVNAFDSSESAMDFIKRNYKSIDIVMTDYKMPHLDGLAVLEEVSALPKLIKKVLLTGYYELAEKGKNSNSKWDVILHKSILKNIDDLICQIND